MECSFCQRREVVYLTSCSETFEVRKCIARVCKLCDSPSIWIESIRIRDPENGAHGTTVEERVIPRRNRTRIKASRPRLHSPRGFQKKSPLRRFVQGRPQLPQPPISIPKAPASKWPFLSLRTAHLSSPSASSSPSHPHRRPLRHGAAYFKPPLTSNTCVKPASLIGGRTLFSFSPQHFGLQPFTVPSFPQPSDLKTFQATTFKNSSRRDSYFAAVVAAMW